MKKTIEILNAMVADGVIDTYVIAGAVAALYYIEPFLTEDLDILINFPAQQNSGLVTLGQIVPYLKDKGYGEWKNEGVMIEGWPVQFLPAVDRLDQEALDNAKVVMDNFGAGDELTMRILSAEHVVAMAVRTGRHKDHARILAFLDADVVDLELLKDVLVRNGLSAKWREFLSKTGQAFLLDLE